MVRGVTHMGTGLFCWRQVYRGVLRQGGQQVAVKVQRPGVRESIALDIYILQVSIFTSLAHNKYSVDLSKHGALFSIQDVLLPDEICCGYGSCSLLAAYAPA